MMITNDGYNQDLSFDKNRKRDNIFWRKTLENDDWETPFIVTRRARSLLGMSFHNFETIKMENKFENKISISQTLKQCSSSPSSQ